MLRHARGIMETVRRGLEDLYGETHRRVLEEARAFELVHEDKATRTFFRRVSKQRHARICIEGLRLGEDDVVATTAADKQAKAAIFYSQLWQSRHTDAAAQEEMIAGITRTVPRHKRLRLREPITTAEVKAAIKKLANGRAPGRDGVAAEFYKVYADELAPFLARLYREQVAAESLTENQRTATVKMLYKKGDAELLSNYRPISLLTADYKVLALLVVQRLKPHMPTLVHPDQSGFIPGRDIADNVTLLQQVFVSGEEKGNHQGVVVALDFQKAYDRLDRGFMMAVLAKMGIDGTTAAMVRTLYSDTRAEVEMDGSVGEVFQCRGGVRQGCPASPLLYVLAVETFLQALRAHPGLRGIRVPETKEATVVSAFADDTTAFLRDGTEGPALKEVARRFCQASGAKLNVDKTAVLRVDPTCTDNLEQVDGEVVESTQILGTLVGARVTEAEQWGPQEAKTKRRVGMVHAAAATAVGRAMLYGMQVAPVVLYKLRMVGISAARLRRMERAAKEVFWRQGGAQYVTWSRVTRPREDGGPAMMDIVSKTAAMKGRRVRQAVALWHMMEKHKQNPPNWLKWHNWAVQRWRRREEKAGLLWPLTFGFRDGDPIEAGLKAWCEWDEAEFHSWYLFQDKAAPELQDEREVALMKLARQGPTKTWYRRRRKRREAAEEAAASASAKRRGDPSAECLLDVIMTSKTLPARVQEHWWEKAHNIMWRKHYARAGYRAITPPCPWCNEPGVRSRHQNVCKEVKWMCKKLGRYLGAGRALTVDEFHMRTNTRRTFEQRPWIRVVARLHYVMWDERANYNRKRTLRRLYDELRSAFKTELRRWPDMTVDQWGSLVRPGSKPPKLKPLVQRRDDAEE